MLRMNNYSQEYIDACRRQIDAQVATYRSLVTVGADLGGSSRTQFDSASRAFEPVFFSNPIPVLENYFVHRSRTIEGKAFFTDLEAKFL